MKISHEGQSIGRQCGTRAIQSHQSPVKVNICPLDKLCRSTHDGQFDSELVELSHEEHARAENESVSTQPFHVLALTKFSMGDPIAETRASEYASIDDVDFLFISE